MLHQFHTMGVDQEKEEEFNLRRNKVTALQAWVKHDQISEESESLLYNL